MSGRKLSNVRPRAGARSIPNEDLLHWKAVEVTSGAALDLLRLLQSYVIFSPTTPVLRGVAPETQPRRPVGLSGGNLPRAILELLRQRSHDDHSKRICRETLKLVDWAKSFWLNYG